MALDWVKLSNKDGGSVYLDPWHVMGIRPDDHGRSGVLLKHYVGNNQPYLMWVLEAPDEVFARVTRARQLCKGDFMAQLFAGEHREELI